VAYEATCAGGPNRSHRLLNDDRHQAHLRRRPARPVAPPHRLPADARASMGKPTSSSHQRPAAPLRRAPHGPSPAAVQSPAVGRRAAPAAPPRPPLCQTATSRASPRRAVVQRAVVRPAGRGRVRCRLPGRWPCAVPFRAPRFASAAAFKCGDRSICPPLSRLSTCGEHDLMTSQVMTSSRPGWREKRCVVRRRATTTRTRRRPWTVRRTGGGRRCAGTQLETQWTRTKQWKAAVSSGRRGQGLARPPARPRRAR